MLDLNALELPELFEVLALPALPGLLDAARSEDLGDAGDVTTRSIVSDDDRAVAAGVSRVAGVAAGLAAITPTLAAFDCDATVDVLSSDGSACVAGERLWRLSGSRGGLLTVERTLLNLVGRLSGIATTTRRYVDAVAGTSAVICDTRKTTPGWRTLEKYAVRCGGGTLHRLGLHDAALYKDNHLAGVASAKLVETLSAAVAAAREAARLRFVEVEVDRLDQLKVLLEGPPELIDIVLLDNMSIDELRQAVAMRDSSGRDVGLEASGRVTLNSVRAIAETGVDRISVGAITHSAPWLDVGLDFSG